MPSRCCQCATRAARTTALHHLLPAPRRGQAGRQAAARGPPTCCCLPSWPCRKSSSSSSASASDSVRKLAACGHVSRAARGCRFGAGGRAQRLGWHRLGAGRARSDDARPPAARSSARSLRGLQCGQLAASVQIGWTESSGARHAATRLLGAIVDPILSAPLASPGSPPRLHQRQQLFPQHAGGGLGAIQHLHGARCRIRWGQDSGRAAGGRARV